VKKFWGKFEGIKVIAIQNEETEFGGKFGKQTDKLSRYQLPEAFATTVL
jgi:hypothetical protein